MTQLKYNKIDSFLESMPAADDSPDLFFLWGHEYLVKEKSERIVNKLLAGHDRNLALEVIDGDSAPAATVIDTVSTLNPFLEKRVVWGKNLPLFSRNPGEAYAKDDVKRLARLIEKGIPDNTCLVVSAKGCDKRSLFFKTVADKGVTVDCTVPEGLRKSDVNEQTVFLRHTAAAILEPEAKHMDGRVFQKLADLTGFDPDTFADNLKKLVSYTGDKSGITATDVDAVARRTKKDPIFEFTGTFCERKIEASLFYLDSLLSAGFHPLQILKALANQVRKLFAAKSFVQAANVNNSSPWYTGQDFNTFKQVTLPVMQEYESRLSKETENLGKATDLLLISNPKNPYPVYQTLKKSDNFSFEELKSALGDISDIDHQMKSSSADSELLLKNFIVTTCTKGG